MTRQDNKQTKRHFQPRTKPQNLTLLKPEKPECGSLVSIQFKCISFSSIKKIFIADLMLVGHRKSHTAVAVGGSFQQQAPFGSSCHQQKQVGHKIHSSAAHNPATIQGDA